MTDTPERPDETERGEIRYTPDLKELGGGIVIDEGKLRALLELIMANARPEDRDYAYSTPAWTSADVRAATLIEVLASDGRYLGAFGPELIAP